MPYPCPVDVRMSYLTSNMRKLTTKAVSGMAADELRAKDREPRLVPTWLPRPLVAQPFEVVAYANEVGHSPFVPFRYR